MQKTKIAANIQFEGRVLYDILGSEVIESDSIAIAEQIKNAKDAKADKVIVDLSKIENDLLIIEDNGVGMSEDDIKTHWLMIGTSNKSNSESNLGGKGIGRLSLFRLADEITIETINNNIMHSFTLNSDSLKEEGLTNIVITQEIVTNQNSKTKIILNKLKKHIDLYEIERGLENLSHPYQSKIHTLIFPESYRKQQYTLSSSILDNAPFYAKATIVGGNISSYDFNCTVKGDSLYRNKVIKSNFKNTLEEELINSNSSNVNLGKINVEIYNFFFDNPYISWHQDINKKFITNDFLQAYQGISVYRNGYKIYGHGDEDWLKLAELRLNKPGDNIDNKLTYGIVTLDSKTSLNLKEKTSREGFIRSPELTFFREIILCIVKQVGWDRKESISAIRKHMEQENNTLTKKELPNNKTEIKKETHLDNKTEVKEITEKTNNDHSTKNNENIYENTDVSVTPDTRNNLNKGKSYLTTNKLIDVSFECNPETPEKIKKIIEELKQITNKYVNSQALLLRCLIDISTDFFQDKNKISKNHNKLPANIISSLNYINDKKLLDHKIVSRIRTSVKKDRITDFFNGAAHEYNYRPTFNELEEIWDIFESYILICLRP